MNEAIRSEAECSASETMPIEPDSRPTTSLKTMSVEFEATDTQAARALSA